MLLMTQWWLMIRVPSRCRMLAKMHSTAETPERIYLFYYPWINANSVIHSSKVLLCLVITIRGKDAKDTRGRNAWGLCAYDVGNRFVSFSNREYESLESRNVVKESQDAVHIYDRRIVGHLTARKWNYILICLTCTSICSNAFFFFFYLIFVCLKKQSLPWYVLV